jgi:hypothetical protein
MRIELSHDLLAKKIYDKASTQDKMLIKVRNFIKDRFAYFKENNVLLSRDDLNYIGPYLSQLTLERHELIFIDRSKQGLRLKAALIIGIIVAVILVVFYFMNQTEEANVEKEELLARQLSEYEEIEAEARALSSALIESREGLDATKEELRLALLKLQQKNDTLLHSYAVYKVDQDSDTEYLKEALNVAQSAKLSELAAPIVSNDKEYAFQLAAKAWNLNPQNEQAMKAIYQTVGASLETPLSKQKTRNFIKSKEKKWGKLSSQQMKAIFKPENKIVANNKKQEIAKQIKKITTAEVPLSASFSRPEEKERKVRAEISRLEQKVQEQIQQHQQKRPINLPK